MENQVEETRVEVFKRQILQLNDSIEQLLSSIHNMQTDQVPQETLAVDLESEYETVVRTGELLETQKEVQLITKEVALQQKEMAQLQSQKESLETRIEKLSVFNCPVHIVDVSSLLEEVRVCSEKEQTRFQELQHLVTQLEQLEQEKEKLSQDEEQTRGLLAKLSQDRDLMRKKFEFKSLQEELQRDLKANRSVLLQHINFSELCHEVLKRSQGQDWQRSSGLAKYDSKIRSFEASLAKYEAQSPSHDMSDSSQIKAQINQVAQALESMENELEADILERALSEFSNTLNSLSMKRKKEGVKPNTSSLSNETEQMLLKCTSALETTIIHLLFGLVSPQCQPDTELELAIEEFEDAKDRAQGFLSEQESLLRQLLSYNSTLEQSKLLNLRADLEGQISLKDFKAACEDLSRDTNIRKIKYEHLCGVISAQLSYKSSQLALKTIDSLRALEEGDLIKRLKDKLISIKDTINYFKEKRVIWSQLQEKNLSTSLPDLNSNIVTKEQLQKYLNLKQQHGPELIQMQLQGDSEAHKKQLLEALDKHRREKVSKQIKDKIKALQDLGVRPGSINLRPLSLQQLKQLLDDLTSKESQVLNERRDIQIQEAQRKEQLKRLKDLSEKSTATKEQSMRDKDLIVSEMKALEKLLQHLLSSADHSQQRSQCQRWKAKLATLSQQIRSIPVQDNYTEKNLTKQIDHAQQFKESIAQVQQENESLLKAVTKLRLKIGALDVPQRVQKRKRDLKELHHKLSQTLITIEAPQLQKILTKCQQDASVYDLRIKNLQNKIASQGNLTALTPSLLIGMSQELNDLGQQMNQNLTDLENVASQIRYLTEKQSNDGLERRLGILKGHTTIEDLKKLSNQVKKLEEFFEEAQNNHSDDEERHTIERVGGQDLKEIRCLIKQAIEKAESQEDRLKVLSLSDKVNERDLCSLENESDLLLKEQETLHKRLFSISKDVSLKGQMKLLIREKEINELERRFGQLHVLIQKIEEETVEYEQRKVSEEQKASIIVEMREITDSLIDLKSQSLSSLMKRLNQARQRQLKGQNIDELDKLIEAKKLKKVVLTILQEARVMREEFSRLRGLHEGCKLRLKTIPNYKPLVGDATDQMISEWIYANSCPIPINRMGNGYYQFGQKKIYAKITNGKLVIRVGGGYMGIDEFMYYYGAQELNKILAYEGIEEEIDLEKILNQGEEQKAIQKFEDGRQVIGSAQMKRRLSPHGGSSGRGSAIKNGSPRAYPSPSRAQTPSILSQKSSLKRSSQGLETPRSTTSIAKTAIVVRRQSLVSTSSRLQSRKSPNPLGKLDSNRQTPQTSLNAADGGLLTIPSSNYESESPYELHLRQTTVSAYDDQPKSKILESIKSKKKK